MFRKHFLQKVLAMLLTVCATIALMPTVFMAEDNEVLTKPVTWWETEHAGMIRIGAGDKYHSPIKATSWYYSVNYEFRIYYNGTTEDDFIDEFYSDSYLADITTTFNSSGEGTYYYKARAIEVDLGTDNETGNVSPWSDMSEGFEYKRPAKAATSFDIEIGYSDCNISGGRYLDFTKEKGYSVTVYTTPFFISTCDLQFDGYPFEAELEIRLPYGSAYFSGYSDLSVTVNGKKCSAVYIKNDLVAIAYYKFEKKNSAPYVRLGNDGAEINLTQNLGKTVNVGGGTAMLTQNGNEYVLELENVSLNGGIGSFLLTSQEYDANLGKYVHETMPRTFGIRANRDITLILKGTNKISSEDKGVYYGIALEEASSMTVTGDGTLDIYAGGIAENGWGGTGSGFGIITGTAFAEVTVESGKINVYPIDGSLGIFASDLNMKGGELTVIGNENRAPIKMSAFGVLRMCGGKMNVTSGQRAQNSGAIETEGGDIYITGGELTAVCKSEDISYGKAVYFDNFASGECRAVLHYYGGTATLIGEGGALEVDDYATNRYEFIRVGTTLNPEEATFSPWDLSQDGINDFNKEEKVKVIRFTAPAVKMIDTIKIDGARLSYKAGDEAEFTARPAEEFADIFTIDEESWMRSDGEDISSNPLLPESPTVFKENSIYTYYLSLKMTEKAVKDGYRFSDNVKLILNGKEISLSPTQILNMFFGTSLIIRDISTVDTGAESYLCGDADGDGTVDIIDAMLVFYHVAKKELMTDEQCRRCDTNDDGEVDIEDAMKIFYYVAKKTDSVR